MTDPLAGLRQQAKILQRLYQSGDANARQRIQMVRLRDEPRKRADFLHVIARENGFTRWPELKASVELHGLDRVAKQQRLRSAVAHGQTNLVLQLLDETPDLAGDDLALQIALYDAEAVARVIARSPERATKSIQGRRPMLHLAYSRMLSVWPGKEDQMIAIADTLLRAGADVNDSYSAQRDGAETLSALYGALGFAGNMPLARWLLAHGANPDDGESLYHATELGHHDGLRLLLEYGANPVGTNALFRAMDFHDAQAIKLLLDAGAKPDDGMSALFHAACRQSPPAVISLLLGAGADTQTPVMGTSPYAAAKVFGNEDLAEALAQSGAATALSEVEQILSDCVNGVATKGRWIDPAQLRGAYKFLLHELVPIQGRMDHIRALVDAGMPWDVPDQQGVPPVQHAGWNGLVDVLEYFLKLGPDLSYVNGFGGTLLGTIIHGSENCPERSTRDHLGCLKIVLEHGVALPRRAIKFAGNPEVASFLGDWAEAHPGQVVGDGLG
ncbi:ankyrin repeat domain-containing protein [Loktanella sp. S4079]|uniref:ankyrin repeat domain-containing protein n=1 Tax=Loktanella sp. S4079 TaxID=579483 RepID=UPI0005FA3AE2|nr:ankyrin repeat domain-containing protein [Loktanella sp. S4079]KJZ20721.1 hypothetical protein TW80_08145 [Loktanella sp. S4079]